MTYSVGDTAPPPTGRAVGVNLTGATARVNVRRPDGTVFSHDVTITDATTGAWLVDLVEGDLTMKGRYDGELEVTFSNTKVQTLKGFTLVVEDEYA